MKYINLKDSTVVGVMTLFSAGAAPGPGFTLAPNDAVDMGWIKQGDGTFLPPVAVTPEIKVSPVEFKLLFTASERVAIKASADPIVKDFFEIVNDPRLTHVNLSLQSTKDALAYLTALTILAAGRSATILAGVLV